MNEERWVRNLAEAARGYNAPPPTPRERMWTGIDQARRQARQRVAGSRPAPWWSRRQVLWPAAVIAALALGLTVGRLSVRGAHEASGNSIAGDGSSPALAPPSSEAYRLAAVPLLRRSETLLLQVGAGVDPSASPRGYTGRAQELLSQTRLLLGSPASSDPELGPLLRDLELALARLVQLAAEPASATAPEPERRALQDGLQRKAVLPRIRDQLAASPAVVGS